MNNYLNRKNDFELFTKEDPFFGGLLDLLSTENKQLMRTDIKETEKDYVIMVDVPGFSKENIKISLDNKYLTIEASSIKNEESKNEKYLHRERFNGTCSRSFYVGDVRQEDIKASFENGVLSVSFPKEIKEEEKVNKYIEIA